MIEDLVIFNIARCMTAAGHPWARSSVAQCATTGRTADASASEKRRMWYSPLYGGVGIAIPVLGIQEQAHNLALLSIIITKVELPGDVVFFHCDHRFQELKGAIVWFNFHRRSETGHGILGGVQRRIHWGASRIALG